MFKKTADLAEDGSPKLILVISPDNTLLDEIKNTQTDITVLNYEDIHSSATIALKTAMIKPTELLAAEALMDEAKETDRLLNQFKEIRDLCNNETKSDFKIFQEDETDLMNAAVRIPIRLVF